MSKPCTVVRTHRSVIEHKLLAALEDKGSAACLFSECDLKDIINALYRIKPDEEKGQHLRQKDLADDMSQLLREAFPESATLIREKPRP